MITELLRKNQDSLNTLLSRLNQAVKDLKRSESNQYIYIRTQLDNEGVDFLDITLMPTGKMFTNIFESSEPQIEKDADLFLECEIGIFLRLIQNESRLEDALIRNNITVRPTMHQLILPGQLARALDGSLKDDDTDLSGPVHCLRCGTTMYIVGPEHHVMDHGKHLLIELLACNACNYLEYQRGSRKTRGYI